MWRAFRDSIVGIDWDKFHFLRPGALWLFVPLGLIVLLLALGNRDRSNWRNIVRPALRPYLFTKGSRTALLLPLVSFFIGTSIGILALAGPAWKKQQLPGEKVRAVMLIALDVSRSMLATDIQPSRLERAKLKLIDLLDANPRARAGLVAFAGSAHPVLPFTGDYQLIRQHAAGLVPRIMPVPGTDCHNLLQTADSMLKAAKAPGTLVLMTDVLSMDDATALDSFVQEGGRRMEILLFSAPEGAAVPGHPDVVSKQDPFVLQNLSQDTAITVVPLTLDRSDVEGIARRISQKLVFTKSNIKDQKEWADRGGLFLLPVLVIALFWFRRGWVIPWCWPILMLPALVSCGLRSKHPDWWYGRDYQGQLLEDAGRYVEAAERYEDDGRKAIAYYKAGNYAAAADLFALDSGASSVYNRGLALAKLGRYGEALREMDRAAKLEPSLKKDVAAAAAAVAKDAVARVLPEKKKKGDPLKERGPESDDEQLSSDTRVKKLPASGNRVTDEMASNIHVGKEAKTPPKDLSVHRQPPTGEAILMRQTEADPSEFLHRRFELQLKRHAEPVGKNTDPW